MHLCTDPQQQHLLTQAHIQPDAGRRSQGASAAAAAAAVSPGYSTPTRQQQPPSTPGKGSSSSKKSKSSSSSKASKQLQQQSGGKPDSSPAVAGAAAQWQLQLLQDSLDWAKPRQLQLLQQLVHKQLMGCCFLPGNIMYLPLLGAQVLCLLQPAAGTPQDSAPQQVVLAGGVQSAISIEQPPLQVVSSTQLQLLPPNEQLPGMPASQAAQGSRSTAAGAAGSSSGQAGPLQQRIAAAREAAAAAVSGSAQEAAMEAAERAVRAGRLGWVESHTDSCNSCFTHLAGLPSELKRD